MESKTRALADLVYGMACFLTSNGCGIWTNSLLICRMVTNTNRWRSCRQKRQQCCRCVFLGHVKGSVTSMLTIARKIILDTSLTNNINVLRPKGKIWKAVGPYAKIIWLELIVCNLCTAGRWPKRMGRFLALSHNKESSQKVLARQDLMYRCTDCRECSNTDDQKSRNKSTESALG